MRFYPNSEGKPDVVLNEGETKFTDKFHRCLGHVRTANAKRGTDYEPYGVCTASIGYSGSYKAGFRRGARTPAGRARKMKENKADLVKRYGLTEFAKAYPEGQMLNVGFSPSRQKWYGWSHRAVAGFGIGDTIKKGDVIAPDPDYPALRGESLPLGFTAKTLDDAKRMAMAFANAVS